MCQEWSVTRVVCNQRDLYQEEPSGMNTMHKTCVYVQVYSKNGHDILLTSKAVVRMGRGGLTGQCGHSRRGLLYNWWTEAYAQLRYDYAHIIIVPCVVILFSNVQASTSCNRHIQCALYSALTISPWSLESGTLQWTGIWGWTPPSCASGCP